MLHHESLPWGSILQELTKGSPAGSQVLPGTYSSKSSAQATASYRASTCSGTGCIAVWIPAPPWTSAGWRGICALVPEVPPLPPHSLICGSLTYYHFSLQVLLHSIFYPFFNVFIEVLLMSLTGSDLASGRSLLEPYETGFAWHGGSLWNLLTEPIPANPPPPLANLSTWTQCKKLQRYHIIT